MFSFVIICLNPTECNRLISKVTILIQMMCKLSFNTLTKELLVSVFKASQDETQFRGTTGL